jgi:glycosyltransferase involved in cell wall biosynthesis
LNSKINSLTFWIIQAQENPADSRDILGRREWRSNTLAEHLADRGHDVTRWRSAFSHNKKSMLVSGNELVRHDNYLHQFINCTQYQNHIGLMRVISHYLLGYNFSKVAAKLPKPSLIHVGNVPSELAYQAVRYGKKIGCPVVVDIRDLWPDVFVDRLPRFLNTSASSILGLLKRISFRLKYSLREATSITAITNPFLDWALEIANRKRNELDKVMYMCNSSRMEKHVFDAHNILNVRETDTIVTYVGNIGYQSDFITIIEAANILCRKGSNIKIIIAGNGPLLENLKKLSNHLQNVIFTGWLDNDSLSHLLRISSIGLIAFKPVSNYIKNIPNKFPEYLVNGLAVACGVEGEMSRLTLKYSCGFVYPYGNEEVLAKSLIDISTNEDDLKKMQRNSNLLHSKFFDSVEIFPAFADHLEHVALKN